MHDWSLSDLRRHTELMEECRVQRERTRILIARSQRLRAPFLSPFAKGDKNDDAKPAGPSSE